MRNIVEGRYFLSALEHVIRNPVYYGITLWFLAAKWVTDFCNNEPNLIPVLQDAGVTEAILNVLSTDIPASPEILSELPNLLAALCLNETGLAAFIKARPLNAISDIFMSRKYLSSMGNDTAAAMGSAMDELLRHQPALREPGIKAIVAMVENLIVLGRSPSITISIGTCLFIFLIIL